MATLARHVSHPTYALHHRDCPPRVCRHGCRRTVRSRSQGRRPARVPMRQEVEFRLKRDVSRASPVARRRRSVDVRRSSGPGPIRKPNHSKRIKNVSWVQPFRRTSKRSSARRSRFRSCDSGPDRSICPHGPWPDTSGTSGRWSVAKCQSRKRSPSYERTRHCE